jgi:predicted RNase H-like HicB family nuclease
MKGRSNRGKKLKRNAQNELLAPNSARLRINLNLINKKEYYDMFSEYMAMALKKAQYKIIDDEYPYFAEVPELDGVWATGKTIEDCRNELIEVIEEWIVARLQRGLSIPTINGQTIGTPPREKVAVV